MRNKHAFNVVSSVTFKTKSEIDFLDVFKVKCAKKVLFKKNVEHEKFYRVLKMPAKNGGQSDMSHTKNGANPIPCIQYTLYTV